MEDRVEGWAVRLNSLREEETLLQHVLVCTTSAFAGIDASSDGVGLKGFI